MDDIEYFEVSYEIYLTLKKLKMVDLKNAKKTMVKSGKIYFSVGVSVGLIQKMTRIYKKNNDLEVVSAKMQLPLPFIKKILDIKGELIC